MTELEQTQCTRRLQTALDLFEAGIELVKARKQREHPEADSKTLDLMVQAWLLERAQQEFHCLHLRVLSVTGQK